MGLTRSSPDWVAQPETETLFTNTAVSGIRHGHVWLTALVAGEKPIAMCLAFNAGGTLYASKITYDAAWENYSPGRTLFLLTIKEGFDRGLKRFDLMVGEAHYKERIGDGRVRVFSRKVSF
jgi:CelD/BcsL family acetyltransferase involved in cellulose biosynthesis